MKVLVVIINNIEVYSLLMNLREILNEKDFSSEVHITIKGPQKTFNDETTRNKFLEQKYPIYIKETGMFNNNGVYVVYLKVQSEFRKGQMWRKPDYKNEYNPHITIYKGESRDKADKIKDFLEKEELSLSFYDYGFSDFKIKQPLLQRDIEFEEVSEQNREPKEYLKHESALEELFKSGGVKKGIFDRAKKLQAEL